MIDIESIEEKRNLLIENATPSELCFLSKLEKWKLKYEFQYPIYINDKLTFFLDFYLPKYNVYIELDGKHHRIIQTVINKDRWRKKLIYDSSKIIEVRIKNKNIYNLDYNKLMKYIKKSKQKR